MLRPTFVCVVAVGIFLIATVDGFKVESNKNEPLVSEAYDNEEEAISKAGNKGGSNEKRESKKLVELKADYEEGNDEIENENSNSLNETLDYGDDNVNETRIVPTIELPIEDQGEVIGAYGNKTCGPPPEIDGANFPYQDDKEHLPGSVVRYQCGYGYVSQTSGGFPSVCTIDSTTGEAEWTEPVILCSPRSCGDPGYVANARRIGYLFTFPNKVDFECNTGYKLRGLKSRYCQTTGEWSGRLPTCELVNCTAPSDPENGRVFYTSLQYGSELRYECNTGFVLENYETRFCDTDGLWSNNEPQCVEAKCQKPAAPKYGSVEVFGEPTIGSLAVFTCHNDTTLVGSSKSKCLSTGIWTFDPPKCVRSCKVIEVSNGEVGKINTVKKQRGQHQEFKRFQIGMTVTHGEAATLLCNPGFSAANSSKTNSDRVEVWCNEGEWSTPMQCLAKCGRNPPRTENASPVIDSNIHGSVIWYKCNPGFDKAQGGRIVCENGTWKGNTPICRDNRCYVNQLNYPGLKKPKGNSFFNTRGFEITCKKGYSKTSLKKRITCVQGQWDIESNPCTIITDNKSSQVSSGSERPITSARDEHTVTTVSIDSHPSPVPVDTCHCTFDYPTDLMKAFVGRGFLHATTEVREGEIVTLRCRDVNDHLVWENGLRILMSVNLTCSACEKWTRRQLPTCETTIAGDSFFLYSDKMKILPGGAIEITKGKFATFRCMNSFSSPSWYGNAKTGLYFYGENHKTSDYFSTFMEITHPNDNHAGTYECRLQNYRATELHLKIANSEILCDGLRTNTDKGNFNIRYANNRKVGSEAYYTCADPNQRLIGYDRRKCQRNGKWSGTYPSCEDITCQMFQTYNGLVVQYSDQNRMNSIATFHCTNNYRLVGSTSSKCLSDGRWSHHMPTCQLEDIYCPVIDGKEIFSIQYSGGRRINSIAHFYCKAPGKKVSGCAFMTCQRNGEWSGQYPTCVDFLSCNEFNSPEGLDVYYSDDMQHATFVCLSPNKLIGSTRANCLPNGTWDHPLPTCEAPKCSIENLMLSIPKDVLPDLRDVPEEEFVPLGTELQLLCEEGSILSGRSKAKCGLQGKWEHGTVKCTQACQISVDNSQRLLVEPQKENFVFGELASFSCPPGYELNSKVERSMCLGNSWSDPIPGCEETNDASSPSVREAIKSG